MSSALQNRLVGTIIVVALAVIFLPDLLDGKKTTSQATFVAVPQAPQRKALVEPQSFPAEEVANAASRPLEVVQEAPIDAPEMMPNGAQDRDIANSANDVEQQSNEQVAGSLAKEQETTAAAMDLVAQTDTARDNMADSLDAGWVVQLGSFRHQKNVRELLDKLENSGYRAFSRPVETSLGRLNKVFVGPELRKEKLEEALPHLREVTGLSGKITEFKV